VLLGQFNNTGVAVLPKQHLGKTGKLVPIVHNAT